jgi:hypothetical protein
MPVTVLCGSVAAAIGAGLPWVRIFNVGWVGTPPTLPSTSALGSLSGGRSVVLTTSTVLVALSSLVIRRRVVRREIAAVMTVLCLTAATYLVVRWVDVHRSYVTIVAGGSQSPTDVRRPLASVEFGYWTRVIGTVVAGVGAISLLVRSVLSVRSSPTGSSEVGTRSSSLT